MRTLSRSVAVVFAAALVATPMTDSLAQRRGERKQPTTTRTAPPTPTGEHMSDRQKGNLKQLQSDLLAIQEGSQVTQQQKDDLEKSLMALVDGATRPDPAAVEKLATDLAEALADGHVSANERYKLAEDLEDVMNSANVPEAEVEKAIADAQAILLASGVTRSDVETIVYDLQQIAAEASANIKNAQTKAKGAVDGAKADKPAARGGARRKP
jgi:hypothetical protein